MLLKTAEMAFDYGLGAVRVFLADRQSKEVTGEKKAKNLPPPIAQKSIDSHAAMGNDKSIHRRLALIEDGAAGPGRDFADWANRG
jgi:hypothetical protein